jgi:mono/diheme cytochrome c family protein
MTTKTGFKRWSRPGPWIGLLYGLALAAAGGCSRPGGPYDFSSSQSEFPIRDSGAPPSTINVQAAATCTPAKTSAPNVFPARTTITGATPGGGDQPNIYRTSDLFSLFETECGGCHVDNTDGGFQVSASSFSTVVSGTMGAMVYGLITSNDTSGNPATSVMPPYGVAYDSRASSDAVVQLATLLNLWLMQGSPATDFTLPTQASGSSTGYAMSASLGAQLTNLGSCIPSTAAVGTSAAAMDQLDSFFAQATQLPATLDQTDLVSLDSATLAKTGVISYAPTYPLWSDNAGKMRYVRVPVGQPIVFDKATQKFSIPANTRFYKTFLKQVTDANGNSTWRKIETRLIVSRPDTTNPDGSAQQNALFGTYLWNADESQANLSNQPLRDNLPFADQIFTYITDEAKDKTIVASNPANLPAAEDAAGITRHYAVPGSSRCMQCHMGSPSEAFVLGFTPLQVARRPTGEGGVYEPAAGDELTQVQRLIDYGVLTGLTSQQDILPLEAAEGSRPPRNQYELDAQAYMVGNCAHCHNPRGYPSVRQPAVADVLIFLPGSGPNEGIFQFPLETTSPLRQRGLNQNVPIPYITPSLYDMPSDQAIAKYFCSDPSNCSSYQWVLAPWRSLIYRNTDTPYDYFDDFALFPHMPLNTSGYDCRVAKLMGDWMVSIPSRVKDPSMPQNLFPGSDGLFEGTNVNVDPQPYEEVLPGDTDYPAAVDAAAARMEQYHTQGFRYGFCPSTYTDDIVDPVIAAEADANVAVTSDVGVGPTLSPTNPNLVIMPILAPIRPDYVALDDTDPPGPWLPRRPDWATALVNPDVPSFVMADTAADSLTTDQAEDLTNVITALENVTITDDTRTALTQKYPFGLWDTSTPGCNFSGVQTAGSYTGADRPQWMTVAPPPDSAPVFVESSGAAIFTTVCFNCHGVNADAQGLLADEITNLTGGDARVADFRDGFLGPLSAPGMNRTAVFGAAASTLGITVDDLSSRYMAWMALGGTNKHLPQDILNEVSLAPVLGTVRSNVPLEGTPDMLRLGLNLCEQLAGSDDNATTISLQNFVPTGLMGWSRYTGLVDSNGDAEMWLRLCNLGNRQMVHVLDIQGSWTATTSSANLFANGNNVYWARSLPTAASPTGDDWYGANSVMDDLGNIQTGVTPDDLFPMCVLPPTKPADLQLAQQALQAQGSLVAGKNVIPLCPDGFAVPAHQLAVTDDQGTTDYVEGRQWAARGAINAALAVFLYLEGMESDPTQRQPLYTQCNLLGAPQ